MAETGWILPTSNNDDNGLENGFNNPANAQTDNSSAAAASSNGSLNVWFWSGFDFATAGLSSGDTVTNVQLRIRMYDSYSDTGTAFNVYWDDSTSNVWSVVSGGTATRMPSTGSSTGTSGSPQTVTRDIQGTQPTASELLDSNFQLGISTISIDSYESEATIEAIWVNVTYTGGGGGGTWSPVNLLSTIKLKQFLGR